MVKNRIRNNFQRKREKRKLYSKSISTDKRKESGWSSSFNYMYVKIWKNTSTFFPLWVPCCYYK